MIQTVIYFVDITIIPKREDIRNKAIKLLLKIFSNLINHPIKRKKYRAFNNAKKINKKLSRCKPAQHILLLSGFTLSNDQTRLIWMNTNENMMVIKYIHNILSSMTNPAQITNINNNHQQQAQLIFNQMQQNFINSRNNITNNDKLTKQQTFNIRQTQQDTAQLISGLTMNRSPVAKKSSV